MNEMKRIPDDPSPQLLARARAGFILAGESLSQWSTREGLQRQNVAAALSGRWKGPKADHVRCRVFEYLTGKGIAT